jgi:alkylation response protein AidB-like acyl-CoA dehydrogenase
MQAGARTFHAVAEALGRRLQPSAFATSALAATRLIDALATEPLRSEMLGSLAAGDTVLALALDDMHGDQDLQPLPAQAKPWAGGWRVRGNKAVALHSDLATRWIVSARSPTGALVLLVVNEGIPGLEVRRYVCLDGSQACDLMLTDVEIGTHCQLGDPGPATVHALQQALDLVELALCAESVGTQARLLDDTVRYVKERQQFGVAIGTFQAVQHRLVDMLVALEQARSLAWLAATEFDTATSSRRSHLTSAAKVRSIVSGRFIGAQSIQLHGGMGVTDALPIGRGVKRLLAIEHSFGDERFHLARVASAVASAHAPSL